MYEEMYFLHKSLVNGNSLLYALAVALLARCGTKTVEIHLAQFSIFQCFFLSFLKKIQRFFVIQHFSVFRFSKLRQIESDFLTLRAIWWIFRFSLSFCALRGRITFLFQIRLKLFGNNFPLRKVRDRWNIFLRHLPTKLQRKPIKSQQIIFLFDLISPHHIRSKYFLHASVLAECFSTQSLNFNRFCSIETIERLNTMKNLPAEVPRKQNLPPIIADCSRMLQISLDCLKLALKIIQK